MQQEKKQKCKWIWATFLLNLGTDVFDSQKMQMFDIAKEPQGILLPLTSQWSRAFVLGCLLVGGMETLSWKMLSLGIKTEVGAVSWRGQEQRHQVCETVFLRFCFANHESCFTWSFPVHREEEAQTYFCPHLLKRLTFIFPLCNIKKWGSILMTPTAGRIVREWLVKNHLVWVLFS